VTQTGVALVAVSLMVWQAPAPSYATLQGTVVDATTLRPVTYAHLVAARVGDDTAANYRTVDSDDLGRFIFTDLTPGSYRLYAQHDGYLQTEYGQRPVDSSGITIAVRTMTPAVVVRMTPGGVIAGRVTDRRRPAQRAVVRAFEPRYVDGERTLIRADWTETDDRGEYRLSGLAPGSYVVSVTPLPQPRLERDGGTDVVVTPVVPSNANNNVRTLRAPLAPETIAASLFDTDVAVPVFYPGTADVAMARPVDVFAGRVTAGVDLDVLRTRPFRVRGAGRAPAPDGLMVTVSVLTTDSRPATIRSVQAPVAGGAFSFELAGVPAGAYVVHATLIPRETARAMVVTPSGAVAPPPGQEVPPQPTLSDRVAVTVVDQDVQDLQLALRPPFALKGRVVGDEFPLSTVQPRPLVQLVGVLGSLTSTAGVVRPDGTFTIPDARPGTYRLRMLRPVWVKSAFLGSEDVRDAIFTLNEDAASRSLEIVISGRAGEVMATVVDAGRRPVRGVPVVAVPAAAGRVHSHLFKTAITDQAGQARLAGVPPGEYRLLASDRIPAERWQDPEVLRVYEGLGELVTVVERQTASVTVRLVP
jgi:hypothetical protein